MFITDEELKDRTTVERVKLSLDADPEDLSTSTPARKVGGHHVMTEGQRLMAGVLSKFDTAANVAEELGISRDHVGDRLRHGKHRGDKVDWDKPEQKEEIEEIEEDVRSTIEDRALEVAAEALGGIDVNEAEGPMKKAALAEKMTTIAGRIRGSGDNRGGGVTNQTIVYYSPKVRDEKSYDTIDV